MLCTKTLDVIQCIMQPRGCSFILRKYGGERAERHKLAFRSSHSGFAKDTSSNLSDGISPAWLHVMIRSTDSVDGGRKVKTLEFTQWVTTLDNTFSRHNSCGPLTYKSFSLKAQANCVEEPVSDVNSVLHSEKSISRPPRP